MSVGGPFRLNKYMPRTRFEGTPGYMRYTDKNMLNIMMGSSMCVKWKKQ